MDFFIRREILHLLFTHFPYVGWLGLTLRKFNFFVDKRLILFVSFVLIETTWHIQMGFTTSEKGWLCHGGFRTVYGQIIRKLKVAQIWKTVHKSGGWLLDAAVERFGPALHQMPFWLKFMIACFRELMESLAHVWFHMLLFFEIRHSLIDLKNFFDPWNVFCSHECSWLSMRIGLRLG